MVVAMALMSCTLSSGVPFVLTIPRLVGELGEFRSEQETGKESPTRRIDKPQLKLPLKLPLTADPATYRYNLNSA